MDDKGSMVLATVAVVYVIGMICGAVGLVLLGAVFP